MYFAVVCRDKPGRLQTRLDNRVDHLAYIERTGLVSLAGPLIEEGQMCGSLIVLDCADRAAADAWVAGDPYGLAGLFESVTVTEWKRVVG